MSSEQKVSLGGYNIKDWAMILLISSIAVVVVVFAIGVALAMIYNPTGITFTGTIDLGQFTAVIIAMASIAAVIIAQQLTSKNQAIAVANTDQVWMAEQSLKDPTKT